jgi:hypothetical protein
MLARSLAGHLAGATGLDPAAAASPLLEPWRLGSVPVIQYFFVMGMLVRSMLVLWWTSRTCIAAGLISTAALWRGSGYDDLVPWLESLHVRPGFWNNWRRSTNVEIAGQGRYRP